MMPCNHNICRECVISKEASKEKIVCYYDNVQASGLQDLAHNKFL